MRLFISYARVDKPYCVQIVEVLDVHDVWYDRRIHAGQKWWDEIQKQIAACEGFVYLLSPESIDSEYCKKEFDIARNATKAIFPVVIHPEVELPDSLSHIHYVDLTKGITTAGVKQLLNSILVAERQMQIVQGQLAINGSRGVSTGYSFTPPRPALSIVPAKEAASDPTKFIEEVSKAFEGGDYDRAVFLLKQAKENGFTSRFINIEAMLQEAEAALERQSYLREAEREYRPIVPMVKQTKMRKLGVKAFQSFREQFPDYDPDNLAEICSTVLFPSLEWCKVPAGEAVIEHSDRHVTYFVDPFRIGKYPVTNAQFQAFVSAEDGYDNLEWWNFSPQAQSWREHNPHPAAPRFSWGDHPRTNVCWYEAMAFCAWVSDKTGLLVTLPTEQQWQRAAQGDDGRPYPWGAKFEKSRCNTRESNLRMTCPVSRHPEGASPYGVHDMAGNVWQWCSNVEYKRRASASTQASSTNAHLPRAVRGGSFISVAQRAKTTFHFYLHPMYRYATIGFRVATAVRETPKPPAK